ncbi:hypothetical protein PROVRETT_06592 [Providencia rettgeri DSM 1131]|nr:hypothetical protein PROVRETT_06592 [Providencia rettgeri DSM 1131]
MSKSAKYLQTQHYKTTVIQALSRDDPLKLQRVYTDVLKEL